MEFSLSCIQDIFSFKHLTTFFMSTWYCKNMQEIQFSWWLFEGGPRQCNNLLPNGLDWLFYLAGSQKLYSKRTLWHSNSMFSSSLSSMLQIYHWHFKFTEATLNYTIINLKPSNIHILKAKGEEGRDQPLLLYRMYVSFNIKNVIIMAGASSMCIFSSRNNYTAEKKYPALHCTSLASTGS